MHLFNDYTRNSDKTESYVVCLTAARSSHYLARSSESPVKLLTCSDHSSRPTHSSLNSAMSAWPVELSYWLPLLVALTKKPISNVPNLKPTIYDTSLLTLSKVQDKACSIKCSKLTSLLRLSALALTNWSVIKIRVFLLWVL